jgi:hypothetical protein
MDRPTFIAELSTPVPDYPVLVPRPFGIRRTGDPDRSAYVGQVTVIGCSIVLTL